MLRQKTTGYLAPVIFPEALEHCSTGSVGWDVVSAGFVSMRWKPDGKIMVGCHGESQSLEMKPDPDDAQTIADWIELGTSGALAIQAGLNVRKMFYDHPGPATSTIGQLMLICSHVGKEWGVTLDEMFGRSRVQPIATARAVAMSICAETIQCSRASIGKFFGGRDDGTVSHAVKSVNDWLTTDKMFQIKMLSVTGAISDAVTNQLKGIK